MSETTEILTNAKLYLESNRGIYIPQNFCEITVRGQITGINEYNWDICLAGPGSSHYWEAWEAILDNAILTEPNTGTQYTLYQDGDLWLIPISPTKEPSAQSPVPTAPRTQL